MCRSSFSPMWYLIRRKASLLPAFSRLPVGPNPHPKSWESQLFLRQGWLLGVTRVMSVERYFLGPPAPSPRSNTWTHQGACRLTWDSSVPSGPDLGIFPWGMPVFHKLPGNHSRWDLWNWLHRYPCKCYRQAGRKNHALIVFCPSKKEFAPTKW